jgi:hypothetical protein
MMTLASSSVGISTEQFARSLLAQSGERWFALLTERQIRRSVKELEEAITAFIADHNAAARLFLWTKSADAIL